MAAQSRSLAECAWGKLNLTLDILRRREDGYHDLRMVMQSVALCDTVRCTTGGEGMVLTTDSRQLPLDGSNLAWRAAEVFFREAGVSPVGLNLHITKRIPVSAGMAGGSTDGAAVLRILRELYCPHMPQTELERIGSLVGSDVPYCVRGTTALAEGRGEKLTDLPPLPRCTILLCKPDFPISTPELFRQVQVKRLRLHPDTPGMIRALEAGDLDGVCRRVYNVFEEVLPKRYQRVLEIKQTMLRMDAMAAAMTGSGPTVFGIFRDAGRAEETAELLRQDFRQVFLTEPVCGDFFDR